MAFKLGTKVEQPIENSPVKMSPHGDDPRSFGISDNDYAALLPKRRHAHQAKGRLLFMPSMGITVVPYWDKGYGWDVVVIEGNETYPSNGFCPYFTNAQIETAIERDLTDLPEKFHPGNAPFKEETP